MLIQNGAGRRSGQWAQLVSAPHPHFNIYGGVVPACKKVTREEALLAKGQLSLRKNMDREIDKPFVWYSQYSLE